MSSSWFIVVKNNTEESHYSFGFKMPSYEMLPLIFMEIEMILFDNSVLKIFHTIQLPYKVI